MRELYRRTAPEISALTLDGPDGRRDVLNVTSEHPFFVEGKGWLEVRRLEKGDRIVSDRGGAAIVVDISRDEKPTLVYNFEVAEDHNYFVGVLGAEAHNAGPSWFWRGIYNNPNTPSNIKGWIQQELNSDKKFWNLRNPPGMDCGHHPSNRGGHDWRSRLEWSSDNRGRPGITGRNFKWR